jgi:hypothetical protein
MPDARSHRGAHPEDARDFRAALEPTWRSAVAELSYLLTRDYAESAALKLVGDRYQLTVRQRAAVLRAACSDLAMERRKARKRELSELAGLEVALDGFNCLITVEAMLAGAPLFVGRDGALRDLASVHGSYRRVEETERALGLMSQQLQEARVAHASVYLDRPVGNSGRLRALYEGSFAAAGIASDVRLSDSVDRELVALAVPVATSDSFILDRTCWFDLPSAVAAAHGLGVFRLTFADP